MASGALPGGTPLLGGVDWLSPGLPWLPLEFVVGRPRGVEFREAKMPGMELMGCWWQTSAAEQSSWNDPSLAGILKQRLFSGVMVDTLTRGFNACSRSAEAAAHCGHVGCSCKPGVGSI